MTNERMAIITIWVLHIHLDKAVACRFSSKCCVPDISTKMVTGYVLNSGLYLKRVEFKEK